MAAIAAALDVPAMHARIDEAARVLRSYTAPTPALQCGQSRQSSGDRGNSIQRPDSKMAIGEVVE